MDRVIQSPNRTVIAGQATLGHFQLARWVEGLRLAEKFATTTGLQRADIAEDVGIPTEMELIPAMGDDRMQRKLQGIVSLPATLRENASSLAMSAMSALCGIAVCSDVACRNLCVVTVAGC